MQAAFTVDLAFTIAFAFTISTFFERWFRHHIGQSALLYCGERALLIRESTRRLHVSTLTDPAQIARDCSGYTLHLDNGMRFRLSNSDASPELRAILDAKHTELEEAAKSAMESAGSPVA